MDFPRLEVFRAVARRLSFSRAAEDLHLSQPAVSKHIRQLEAEWGVPLFQRLGNRVELTEAGRLLADYAGRVAVLTEDVRRVIGELEGLQRGALRLGASSTPGLYLLPDVLARFQAQFPRVEASLAITNSADVARRVLAGEFDLGFVGSPADGPGLQSRPFVDDEIVLVAPPRHALLGRRTFTREMLAGETLIVREAGSGTRQAVEVHLARLGMAPGRVVEMVGVEATKRAVAAGLGVAFISRRAIGLEAAHRLLSTVEMAELRFARPLALVTRKDARPSSSALAFLALVRKGVGPVSPV